MNIKRVGEFYINTRAQDGFSIGIETENLDACVEEAKQKRAVSVFGSPNFGFKQTDLNFLNELPQIESVWFWNVALDDVEGLYGLKSLRKFGVHPKRPKVDFGRLTDLEELVWYYNAKDVGVATLDSLKLFHIWHFNPRSKSYESLSVPRFVEELQIIWANPETLSGLPVLQNLKCFEVDHARNLKSLDGLANIAPNLEKLVVDNCKRLTDFSAQIKALPSIKFASVNGSVLVKDGKSECSSI